MQNTSVYNVLDPNCPSRRVLALLAEKWVLLVILALARYEPLRNGELKRAIGDISQKMLIQKLRQLEAMGIITRTAYLEIPPRVEYRLTDLGRSLLLAVDTLCLWAEAHVDDIAFVSESKPLTDKFDESGL